MDYTREAKEEMFQHVLSKIQKDNEEKPLEQVGYIDKAFLEALTGQVLSNEEAILSANKELTEAYKHIVVAYGFKTFYDLFLYATADEIAEEGYQTLVKSNKDYDNLNKVKRTVIRNGRRVAITFYEKAKDGTDNKQKQKPNSNQGNQEAETEAKDFQIIGVGDFINPIPNTELYTLNELTEGFMVYYGEQGDCDRIKLLLDSNNQPKAVIGISKHEHYLELEHLSQDLDVTGLYPRAFYELIKVALNTGLGVRYLKDGTKEQKILAETSELDETDLTYEADYDHLLELFGELM